VPLDTGANTHLLVLSGAGIAEPVVMEGPFIMNDTSQVRSAIDRYRSGAMGHLSPAPTQRRSAR
jgi:redox-sensitive bicupin YhaK (pirin superfamily)